MIVQVDNKPYNKKLLDSRENVFLEPFPVGFEVLWSSETPPNKGFIVKGQLVNRSEAPELYEFAKSNNLIKSESEWQSQKLYGFYSDGDGKTTFRLPLYAGYKRIGYDASKHTMGKVLDAAIPNILGKNSGVSPGSNSVPEISGAFVNNGSREVWSGGSGNIAHMIAIDLGLDASRCSSIYKNGLNTVQTPDIPQNYVVKYKL